MYTIMSSLTPPHVKFGTRTRLKCSRSWVWCPVGSKVTDKLYPISLYWVCIFVHHVKVRSKTRKPYWLLMLNEQVISHIVARTGYSLMRFLYCASLLKQVLKVDIWICSDTLSWLRAIQSPHVMFGTRTRLKCSRSWVWCPVGSKLSFSASSLTMFYNYIP
jgi:Pyruvate/2-oxoacid:ferredoxin oxidoreductase delta subunit